MRPLNERERRTIRVAAVALGIYLVLFYGLRCWSWIEGKREEHGQLLAQAETVKVELLRERVKAARLQKLKGTFRIEPAALRRETVVGEASSAIQRAAQAQGIQLGPAREMSGRLTFGSSFGSGSRWIVDRDPVISITILASSRMVNSPGFPTLIGPMTSSPGTD